MQHQHIKKSKQTHQADSQHNNAKYAHRESVDVQSAGVPLYLQRQPVEEEGEMLQLSRSGIPTVQAKLTIGAPDDEYEREADRVADQVMRMPDPELQRQAEPDEEELIQVKTTGGTTSKVTPATSSGIRSLQGGGQPLSGSERSFFEPRFGADFSNVRLHNDMRAASIARSVGARAFTLGTNVVFGAGEYSSASLAGRKLLAHELTHVVQQIPRQVKPTKQAKGEEINDKVILKQKADIKGAKALQMKNFGQLMRNSMDQRSTSLREGYARRISPKQYQFPSIFLQRQEKETPTTVTPAKRVRAPFTLASLDNTWHQVVNNFVNWAMRGLEQANLPVNTPGKVFLRGLANDFAWITVGIAASFAGPIAAPAVAMAKSLIDRSKEQIKLWTASKFSAIKAIIRKRLSRLSVLWKAPKLKWAALRRVLKTLGSKADMNNRADVDRRRRLIRAELTGRPNDTDTAISSRIRQDVQDRWAYFKETVALQKRRVREARRKESFTHWIARGVKGIGYWDKDDDSPGLNTGDAMKMPKGYIPPSRRGPAFRRSP